MSTTQADSPQKGIYYTTVAGDQYYISNYHDLKRNPKMIDTFLKLVSKTPDRSKFKIHVVPDKIDGVGLDQPHYTIKGRNACKRAIHRQIQIIESIVTINGSFVMEIKKCLNEIRFLIHILNGNRLGAEKAQNKIELHCMEILDVAMYPDEKIKWGGGVVIDKDGNVTQTEQPSDFIPEQRVIEIGEEAKDTHFALNWCMDNIDIISKIW